MCAFSAKRSSSIARNISASCSFVAPGGTRASMSYLSSGDVRSYVENQLGPESWVPPIWYACATNQLTGMFRIVSRVGLLVPGPPCVRGTISDSGGKGLDQGVIGLTETTS